MCRCGKILECVCLPQHNFRVYPGHEPIEDGCKFWDRKHGKSRRLDGLQGTAQRFGTRLLSRAARTTVTRIRAGIRAGRYLPLCDHIHYGRVQEETLRFLACILFEPARSRAQRLLEAYAAHDPEVRKD